MNPTMAQMTGSGYLIQRVEALLRSWGWVQHRTRDANGFDLIGAFEEIEQCQLLNASPEVETVHEAFANPRLDAALRLVSDAVGSDPDDGDLPEERWAWVHRITAFTDAPTTDWPTVVKSLHVAVRDAVPPADPDRPAEPSRRSS